MPHSQTENRKYRKVAPKRRLSNGEDQKVNPREVRLSEQLMECLATLSGLAH